MENTNTPDTSSRPYQNSEGNKPENKKYLILLICLAVIVAGFIITRPKVFRFITGRKMPTPTAVITTTPTFSPTSPPITTTPTPPMGGGPVLKEDFTSLSIAQLQANGWTHRALGNNNSEFPDNSPNFALIDSPGRPGEKALKLTIGPDDWVYDGDLNADKERAELTRISKTENLNGSEWWYAWSVYIPADDTFVHGNGKWMLMGQFHDGTGLPLEPPIHVAHRSDGTNSLLRFEVALSDAYPPGEGDYDAEWITVPVTRGAWTDIKLNIRWSQQPADGWMDIWVNGTYQGKITAPNMYDHNPNYFRLGVYRGNGHLTINTYYFGRVRAARTEAGLQLP